MLAYRNYTSNVVDMRSSLLFIVLIWSLQIDHSAVAKPPTTISILNKLDVKGKAPKTGYSRAQFSHWSDPDRNGCDARNDTLKRDLKKVIFKNGTQDCKVVSGELLDPFSGKLIIFDLTLGSSNIDIDHVVSLSNSWQTGAAYFSKEKRSNLANDPLNLISVDAKLNRQKGDGDAATWLPPLKSYRCEYVSRQVAVKSKYSLWVTAPEKSAMLRILQKCSNQRVPTS
jgi:hypothetical protein